MCDIDSLVSQEPALLIFLNGSITPIHHISGLLESTIIKKSESRKKIKIKIKTLLLLRFTEY